MKKIMSVLLGLSLMIGAATVSFAAQEGKETAKKGSKKGTGKKGTKSTPDAK